MENWTRPRTSIVAPRGIEVPTRAEEVSAEWLSAALHHSGVISRRSQVVGFEATPLGEGRGVAGKLVRIQLHYDVSEPGAPTTVVGKFASDHEPSRRLLREFDGYAREVRFYREPLFAGVVPAPKAYLAHYDVESGDFFLLLEDLAPSVSPDRGMGLTLAQARLILDELAAFHGRFWNRTQGLEWLRPSQATLAWVSERFLAALPNLLSRLGDDCPAMCAVARHLSLMFMSGQIKPPSDDAVLTLAHSDLHLDNIFLPSDVGGRFALIDWQSLTLAPRGTRDVARLLCSGLPVELRRAHELELLRHYHAALQRAGVDNDDFDALRLGYYQETMAIMVLWTMAVDTFDLSKMRGSHDAMLITERLESAQADACRCFGIPVPSGA